MHVQLYGCYRSDKRLSMDIYTRQLHLGLENAEYQVNTYTPVHRLEQWSDSRLVMRYLRYREYPRQVRKQLVRPDVVHVADHGYAHLYHQLPAGIKVITVHDLIPYLTWLGKIPSTGRVHKPRLNLFSLKYLERFDRIISVSHSTANDLVELLGISPRKISVIPPIIATYFEPQSEDRISAYKNSLGLSGSVKLVMLSGADHYKNVRTSLRVLKGLIDSGNEIQIVRTGFANAGFMSLVAEFGLQKRVHSVYVEQHQELATLYSAVDCLLFPSWYEGFGMPVVEALGCGTCVVSSNAASLPEAGGDLALTAEPNDIEALSNHVLTCLYDENHQRRVLVEGNAWAQNFHAAPVTNRMIQAYDL